MKRRNDAAASSNEGSDLLHDEDPRGAPRLSERVRLRREEFGGLVFVADEMAVYEVNDRTYQLLSAVDGNRTLNGLLGLATESLGGSREGALQVLKDLLASGVIVI